MKNFNQERFRKHASEGIRNILKDYSKAYTVIGDQLIDRIIANLNGKTGVYDAINKAMNETGFIGKNRDAVLNAAYLAACEGYGILPKMVADPSGIKNKLLSQSWTADKMPLSDRLHTKAIQQKIGDTITASMRNADSVKEMARKLYDGYNSGNQIIATPKLPGYLNRIKDRAMMAGASPEYMAELRGDIKKLLENADKMVTPDLRAAYKKFLETCMSPDLKQSAIEKAAEVAVQERARYYAERIARTESARAWFDGFLAENQDDPEVWGYRWVLSGRHYLVPFDQCDVCANMNIGFGKGIYPKDKVPKIPRHPHCMCMLEIVYEWEVDKEAEFNPNGAREYLDSLTPMQQMKLFGIEGAERYRAGDDWQGLLRGWHKFSEPKSRLGAADFTMRGNEYKKYTLEEIKAMAGSMNEIAGKYIEKPGKWSGKIEIADNGNPRKAWNCDIVMTPITSNDIILHELLHARSISYYDKQTYLANLAIEEAAVHLLTQEICKKEKINITPSGYDDLVNVLRRVNKSAMINENMLLFALMLYNIEVPERLGWLEEEAYQHMTSTGTVEDYNELNDLIVKLTGLGMLADED